MIIFIIILVIIILILFSSIKFNIYFSEKGVDYYYKIDIIYFIKLFSLDKGNIKNIIEKGKNIGKIPKEISFLFLKYLKIKKFILDIKVGLIEIIPTVFSIPIISTIISLFISYLRKDNKVFKYNVMPVYNELHLSTKFSCIASLKVGHIIYIILKFFMRRKKEDVRASNRRSYEYCNE